MKIGILTYHAACNFGANLQILSTIFYLHNQGHNPIIINWFTKELENYYLKNTPSLQVEEHKNFRDKYFPLTNRCFNDEDIIKEIEKNKIEAIIVGSDAVAQHHPFLSRIVFPCKKIITIKKVSKDRTFPNPFWGSFYNLLEKKIPLVMMSASSQNSAYKLTPNFERKEMNLHLSNFSFISVRDQWTSKMIQYISNNKIQPKVTPDPVFAFNNNIDIQPSKEEILQKFNLPADYYLLSFLNQKYITVDWLNEFEKLATEKGIASVALPFPQGIKFNHPLKYEINLPLSPIDWYALIKYSKGYIGNNMHPIVVCLHNGVPCFSFDNYGIVKYRLYTQKNSSKIYHIMKRFNVMDNHIIANNKLYKCPTPLMVLNKIHHFSTEGVKTESVKIYRDYLKMMDTIVKTLIDNKK